MSNTKSNFRFRSVGGIKFGFWQSLAICKKVFWFNCKHFVLIGHPENIFRQSSRNHKGFLVLDGNLIVFQNFKSPPRNQCRWNLIRVICCVSFQIPIYPDPVSWLIFNFNILRRHVGPRPADLFGLRKSETTIFIHNIMEWNYFISHLLCCKSQSNWNHYSLLRVQYICVHKL